MGSSFRYTVLRSWWFSQVIMASLARFCSRALVQRNLVKNAYCMNVAKISTSKKDTTTVTDLTKHFKDDLPEKFDARVTQKQWVSWGFDFEDREQDRTFVHLFFFAGVTLVFVTGSWWHAYLPTRNLGDWAQREAYLEIKRRESLGLPYIDKNLIPIDPADLPTDEELGDTEI